METSIEDKKVFSINLAKRSGRTGRFMDILASVAEKMLSLRRFNCEYEELVNKESNAPFAEQVLETLRIGYEISDEDRQLIPKEGPVVVVANHPFGMIEGIVLADLLAKIRPDVKIVANYMLEKIPALKDMLLFVDPFANKDSKVSNFKAIKSALQWLRDGGMIVMFPAGEVSHINLNHRAITDPKWFNTCSWLVKKTGASVLPIYFNGANSILFQAFGLIHPGIRTMMLPRQLFNKSDKVIHLKAGKPIPNDKLKNFENENDMTSYLRLRTYLLSHACDIKGRAGLKLKGFLGGDRPRRQEEITRERNRDTIVREIENLPESHYLTGAGPLQVFHASYAKIPNVVMEIGRLREITFRLVKEGTGNPSDNDRFDYHYEHMFIWNSEKKEIVGSYRLGLTDEIIAQHGKAGLYTSTLFRFKNGFIDHVNPAIELGRSFIRPEYQKEYSPLFLLWKGIGEFVVRNPKYHMLFGTVSIPSDYRYESKKLLVEYASRYFSIPESASLVTPRHPFKYKTLHNVDLSHVACRGREIDELATLVSELEPDRKNIPVLLRQYLKLGGRIVAFTVDHDFSCTLDGLIIVDLKNTDAKMLRKYMGDSGLTKFAAYHEKQDTLMMEKLA